MSKVKPERLNNLPKASLLVHSSMNLVQVTLAMMSALWTTMPLYRCQGNELINKWTSEPHLSLCSWPFWLFSLFPDVHRTFPTVSPFLVSSKFKTEISSLSLLQIFLYLPFNVIFSKSSCFWGFVWLIANKDFSHSKETWVSDVLILKVINWL